MHSNLYLFGHPRATWFFSKLQQPQYYFPQNFKCNLKCYESKNFSDSSLQRIFPTKNSLTCEMRKIQLKKILGKLLDDLQNGTVVYKCLAFPKL